MNILARRLVAALLFALAAPFCFAQNASWPTKPVRFVVPFPPGGSVDALARLLAAKLTETTGQPFQVENRTGASGSIATAFVAKAPADGTTFLVAFDTHAINPSLIPNLPYDTARDFAPVMLVGTAPQAIAVSTSKPFKTFDDVVRAAKANPKSVSYGSTGNGTLGHLMMTLLQQAGGFEVIHAPYKGAGPMITDVLGGQVDLAVATVAIITPHVKGGKLRAIAVSSDQRASVLPDVPTLAEQGFPGFSGLSWWGIFAPAATPRPVIDRFHAALAGVINQPEIKSRLTDQLGMTLVASSPEALGSFVAAETERWGKVIREHKIAAD